MDQEEYQLFKAADNELNKRILQSQFSQNKKFSIIDQNEIFNLMKQPSNCEAKEQKKKIQKKSFNQISSFSKKSSSKGSDDDLCHVDLFNQEKQKQVQISKQQKIRDKLQKRQKQLDAEKVQLKQSIQQQQKLQSKIQKQRMKNLKKGASHSQKQFQEDEDHELSEQEGILQCSELYGENQKGLIPQKQQSQGTKIQGNGSSIDDNQHISNQDLQKQNFEEDNNSSSYEDIDNESQYNSNKDYSAQNNNIKKLLKQRLIVSDELSPQFHRFYDSFQQNVNYIIQYEYNILPEQKQFQLQSQSSQSNQYYIYDQRERENAEMIFKRKFDNLRKLCEQNCKCFQGPHSVLQVFIEKIVLAVESFQNKLKTLAQNELQLWQENHPNTSRDSSDDDGNNFNELNYSINGIDLNIIFKMQSLSQKSQLSEGLQQGLKDGLKSADLKLNKSNQTSSVEQKLKSIEKATKSVEAKEKLRQLGKLSDQQIQQLVQKAGEYIQSKKQKYKFKPLAKNLQNYTKFFQNVITHYNLIIKNFAPAISRHFTEMTQVIKEGNQYEFPSQDIHRTIINKLIINDSEIFRNFFSHISQEYYKDDMSITKKVNQLSQNQNLKDIDTKNAISKQNQNLMAFSEVYEQFLRDVEADIYKGVQVLNINYYMRDLRKNAIEEYEEVYQIEKVLLMKHDCTQSTCQHFNSSNQVVDPKQLAEYNEKLNQRYGFILDAKEKKKLKKKQRKRGKKKQQQSQPGSNNNGAEDQSQNQDQDRADSQSGENESQDRQTSIEKEDIQNFKNAINDQIQILQAHNIPDFYNKNMITNQFSNEQLQQFLQNNEIVSLSNQKKKKKSGGCKFSNEQIHKLSTEELFSYIESNSAKMKPQGAPVEKVTPPINKPVQILATPTIVEVFIEAQTVEQAIQNPLSTSERLSQENSKHIQSTRAKAKAFIENKVQIQHLEKQKSIDPNKFTCKFCNGTIDSKSIKFIHENRCLTLSSQIQQNPVQQQPHTLQKAAAPNATNQISGNKCNSNNADKNNKNQQQQNAGKDQKQKNSNPQQQAECNISTLASNSQLEEKEDLEEDLRILEFARKLENIQIGSSCGQRRRRKLKPNVSKDWLNKLRRQLKNNSNEPIMQLGADKGIEISHSSERGGGYTSSSNSNSNDKNRLLSQQSDSNANQKKKGRLSDLTLEHIVINHEQPLPTVNQATSIKLPEKAKNSSTKIVKGVGTLNNQAQKKNQFIKK